MARASMRTCRQPRCPVLVPAGTRDGLCQAHSREADRARGTARQRGYDSEHDRLRARLIPLAYFTACPRCGQEMLPGQALQLGHTEDRVLHPEARADRVEHAACNEAAGARLGNALRSQHP